jgi:hypothetical protein
MEKQSSGMGVIVGILIIVVLAIVAWVAYTQGVFTGKQQNTQGLEINLGGGDTTNK